MTDKDDSSLGALNIKPMESPPHIMGLDDAFSELIAEAIFQELIKKDIALKSKQSII